MSNPPLWVLIQEYPSVSPLRLCLPFNLPSPPPLLPPILSVRVSLFIHQLPLPSFPLIYDQFIHLFLQGSSYESLYFERPLLSAYSRSSSLIPTFTPSIYLFFFSHSSHVIFHRLVFLIRVQGFGLIFWVYLLCSVYFSLVFISSYVFIYLFAGCS